MVTTLNRGTTLLLINYFTTHSKFSVIKDLIESKDHHWYLLRFYLKL